MGNFEIQTKETVSATGKGATKGSKNPQMTKDQLADNKDEGPPHVGRVGSFFAR